MARKMDAPTVLPMMMSPSLSDEDAIDASGGGGVLESPGLVGCGVRTSEAEDVGTSPVLVKRVETSGKGFREGLENCNTG